MSSNTENPPQNTNQPLIQTQNHQMSQQSDKKQEIPQIPQQGQPKELIQNEQPAVMQPQSVELQKNNTEIRPEEQIKLNQQNSVQLSSRIQNNVRNTLFNNQKISSCHCKKSKCLKMYCQCFAKGNKCRETCKCIGCENTKNLNRQKKPDSRNDEEICRSEDSNKKSLKPKQRACNCKKSFCLKKYCECFNANQPCGQSCKCEDCKNNGESNHFREDKNQCSIPVSDNIFFNVSVNRQISEMSQANGIIERKQEQISVKRRQKLDQDEIQTKISQILKLVPQQNYQTMLDFLAYYLS